MCHRLSQDLSEDLKKSSLTVSVSAAVTRWYFGLAVLYIPIHIDRNTFTQLVRAPVSQLNE